MENPEKDKIPALWRREGKPKFRTFPSNLKVHKEFKAKANVKAGGETFTKTGDQSKYKEGEPKMPESSHKRVVAKLYSRLDFSQGILRD